jgi:transcription termination factor NusB
MALGGLGLFLIGMKSMGEGLELAAGNKLRTLLQKITSNKFFAMLVGVLVTAVIQSSSATDAMVVGFANAGLMELSQAIGVLFGAKIGTTVTSLLMAIDIKAIVSGLCDCDYEDADYFVKASVIHAVKYYDEAVDAFNAHMTKWTFDRKNRLTQALLLLSYVHFFYFEEKTDKKVVIDIAVRLAKTYLEPNEYKFVNAILENVLVRA